MIRFLLILFLIYALVRFIVRITVAITYNTLSNNTEDLKPEGFTEVINKSKNAKKRTAINEEYVEYEEIK
jgi:hypothetical protein